MFYLIEAELTVPVPPDKLDLSRDINDIVLGLIRNTYEDSVHADFGYIIAVLDSQIKDLGYILPNNPSVFFKVNVKLLTFKPEYSEVLEGPIADVTQTGVYVNIGVSPKEIMISVNALGREHFRFDTRKKELIGTKSKLVIKVGDWIRGKLFPAITASAGITRISKVRVTIRTPIKLEKLQGDLRLRMSSKDPGLGLLKVLYRKRLESAGEL